MQQKLHIIDDNLGHTFCPIGPKNFFGPIPWQAAEIIGGLLATELQSDRHSRVLSIRVGEIFYAWFQ